VAAVDGLSRAYWEVGVLLRPSLEPSARLDKITGGYAFILRKAGSA
jgi:hypothetical protein